MNYKLSADEKQLNYLIDMISNMDDNDERLKPYLSSLRFYKKRIRNSLKGKTEAYYDRLAFSKIKYKMTKPDKCQECKREETRLALHHIDKNKKNNSFDNLIFLCYPCHRRRHPELPAKLFGL